MKSRIFFTIIALALLGVACQKTQPTPPQPSNLNSPTAEIKTSNVNLDTDSDGLTDVEEIKLGTNINLKDTDGDGYSDGEEVANGYNPLGPGKLVKCEQKQLPVIGNLAAGQTESNCYHRAAIEQKDINLCNKVDKNSVFYPNCFMGVAILKNDPTICDVLNNDLYSKQVDKCKQYVSIFNSTNKECKNGDDECNQNIGLSILDTSYCRKMTDKYHSDFCSTQVIEIKPTDESFCPSFKETFDKDKCYQEIAIEKKDLNLCNKVIAEGRAYECRIAVAVALGDQKICDDLSNKYLTNSCYMNFPELNSPLVNDYLIKDNAGDYKFEEVYQFNNKILPPEQIAEFRTIYKKYHIPVDSEQLAYEPSIKEYDFWAIQLGLVVFKTKNDADAFIKKNYLDQFPEFIKKEKIAGHDIYTSGNSGGATWVSNNVYINIDAEKYFDSTSPGGGVYAIEMVPFIEAYLKKYPPTI